MKKTVLSLVLAASVFTVKISAQIGINTPNPIGAFTVDGGKDNPATGTPTAAQQANDFSIATSGNVGIGTVSPTRKLDVEGSGYFNAAITSATTKEALDINIGQDTYAYGNRADNFGINMRTSSSINGGRIARINFGDVNTGASNSGPRYLSFSVGITPNELMYLTDDNLGRVGIGNTAPAAKLDIVGDYFGIKRSQGSGSWDNLWIDLSNTSAPAINASGAETGLQFKVGANAVGTYGDGQTLTTVATLRPNGNFGIGTAAPGGRLHVDGGESRFSVGTSIWALSPSTGGTTGSSNSFEIIDRINNVRRMVFNDNGDLSLGGAIVNNSAGGVISIRSGNVGISTASPTELLDVNGNTRVRAINTAAGTTVVNPVYSDPTGVLVKAATSTYGSVIANTTAAIASGATGTLITNMVDGAIYKAIVTSYNGCVDSSVAEFYVTARAGNGFYSINGLGGNIGSGSTSKSPTFAQNSRTSISTTWTGVVVCQDGGNGTAFNYTLAMPSAGTINITNNGNVSKNYTIVLTRMN
ncbi:hypothetical protein [Chryseobacterium sp. JUb7]|uniref:hypothetical protein n=1 Tax=Chryseobacterium sp. JUb7 TaxID=2940599 RepID=UPI002169BC5E|nr:hypothetical protein [Chryseobacterium sp. JUb7]MCS3529288.1 hypothetical protein [Chryseobacterium sp. JUb7]